MKKPETTSPAYYCIASTAQSRIASTSSAKIIRRLNSAYTLHFAVSIWSLRVTYWLQYLFILCYWTTFFMKKVRDKTVMNMESLRISWTAMDPFGICIISGHSAGGPDEIHGVRISNNWSRARTLPPKRHTRLLGSFAKLCKSTVSLVMSVHQSVSPYARNNSAPTERIFIKFDICIFFENMPSKFRCN
jgi:hypothetical protein